MTTPAKFSVIKHDAKKKTDLRLFMSSIHKEPDEHTHMKAAINIEKFTFASSNKDKFLNEFIYISVFSLTGCSIIMTINFPLSEAEK